ncbi:MAG: UDP-N-acetylmuramoyl-tripeptide--D-alanyl-D-alanine ligase [Planctomycetota bacterium]|jgi:UDP-N-acetylmuramoyl-tripeptide--D-alanyl-D-alanine ligase
MKKLSITELARIIGAQPFWAGTNESETLVTGVSIDSRTIQPGDSFFAIAGENFDGHDHVADAFAKGAVCAVVSKDTQLSGGTLLKVPDTIKAMGDWAKQYRLGADFKVVGITGSVGKTTTRQIAYHVLSQRFRTIQAPKNFNNDIGLPLTLLSADPDDEIVVAELGSNHPGEIAYLTRIAQPDIAVVTSVHPAHLEGFNDLETIIREKLSISEGLRSAGVIIINGCCEPLVSACRAQSIACITFGESDGCDVRPQDIAHDGFGSRFTIDRTEIFLPLLGRGNVENAVAAWAVCSRLGIDIDDFAEALLTLPKVPLRTELLQIGTLTVLNDSYNANPASMKNALDILARLSSSKQRRSVFICGDMAELGQQSQRLHTELGVFVAQAEVRLLLAVGEFAQVVADIAKSTAKRDLQAECFEDTASVCNNLEKFIKEDDIVLVKGSRTARLETAVEKLKQLFAEGKLSSMSRTEGLRDTV